MLEDVTKEEIKELIETMQSHAYEDFPGYNVPCSDVLLQKTTPTIALVFGKLWLFSHADNKFTNQRQGYCSASLGTIAKQLHLSINTVKSAIATLEGDPEIWYGDKKKTNKYFTCPDQMFDDLVKDNKIDDYIIIK